MSDGKRGEGASETRNPVKAALEAGRVSLGTWIQIGHPAVAEILAEAGFDWLAVDCEHTDIDVKGFTDLARGMYGRGPAPLARVRYNETIAIRQVLDAGAMGVIVPLVNNAADAERAAAAAAFPPRGVRGSAFFRANDYGRRGEAYFASAPRDTLVIVMIETREAVESIDGILGVDGVDGVFIGPYDLSASYGVAGQMGHPLVMQARKTILEACKRAGKAPGLHVVLPDPQAIGQAVDEGFTFLAVGMDGVFIMRGAEAALGAARQAAGGAGI